MTGNMVPGRRSSSSKSTTATTTRPSDSLRLLFAAALLAILGSVRGEAENLRPEADLTSNCFGFPARNFVKNVNSVSALHGQSPFLLREPGEAAIDFTLHDTRGQAWNLREHLEGEGGKPVVLIWGMYTCPAYQGMGTDAPWDKCGYRDEFDLVSFFFQRFLFNFSFCRSTSPTLFYKNISVFIKNISRTSAVSSLFIINLLLISH